MLQARNRWQRSFMNIWPLYPYYTLGVFFLTLTHSHLYLFTHCLAPLLQYSYLCLSLSLCLSIPPSSPTTCAWRLFPCHVAVVRAEPAVSIPCAVVLYVHSQSLASHLPSWWYTETLLPGPSWWYTETLLPGPCWWYTETLLPGPCWWYTETLLPGPCWWYTETPLPGPHQGFQPDLRKQFYHEFLETSSF